jgi:Fe2+ or Zn2+ uptake regulation protein
VPDAAYREFVLRAVGAWVTRPRLAALDAVHAHPHVDTGTLMGTARAGVDAVSHQAVYDVFRALNDSGLVRRIQPDGSVALRGADRRQPPPRLPLLRRHRRRGLRHRCRALPDPSDDGGFVVDEAEVVYWGLCPSCAAGRSPASPDRPRAERGTP